MNEAALLAARVIDAAPVGMILTDDAGRILFLNATAAALFGYARDELIGESIELLVPELFRGRHHELRAVFARDPGARPMGAAGDLYGLRKDGSELAIEIGMNPIDVPGSGPCVVSAITDVSERRRKAWVTGLQVMTAGLAGALSPDEVEAVVIEEGVAALGAVSEGLWLIDEAGRTLELHGAKGFVVTSEEAFRRISLEEKMPLPILDAVRAGEPIWFESFDDLVARYPDASRLSGVRRGSVACLPLVIDERAIGALSISFPASHRLDADARSALVTMARLCAQALHRGRLFQATERARADAERAVRAREDLLAIVSHDLRNPLAAVSLKARIISRLCGGDESTRDRVDQQVEGILQAVLQMDRMVQDLLDLAKIESGQLLAIQPAPRDATELALQAVQMMEPLAGARRLELGTELALGRVSLFCDGDRILQVFSNLIGNAIKYTREGGTITVRGLRLGREVVFSIIDTGEGIAEDHLPNIFDPYWQAKEDREGIGLGLSVAKAIVESHGGRIWAESTPGRGSTFSFALPVLEGETTSPESPNLELTNGAEEAR